MRARISDAFPPNEGEMGVGASDMGISKERPILLYPADPGVVGDDVDS